jgi:hypothetical protein
MINRRVVLLNLCPSIIDREPLELNLANAKLNLQLVMINPFSVSMDLEFRRFDSAVLLHTTGNNKVNKVGGGLGFYALSGSKPLIA